MMDALIDEPIHHRRRGIVYDPTVTLGHIGSATVFLLTAVSMFVILNVRVDQQDKDQHRIETQLTEKIRSTENIQSRFEMNYREDLRDLKTMLKSIDDKLDKKMDKPR